jgi:plasmid stabilization system protein ParE
LKVIYRNSAVADLERIFDWIAEDSPANAVSVADRILDAVDSLLSNAPYIGRVGKVPGTREWIVRGLPYIIVYEVDADREAVSILSIVHGAQQR